MNLRTKLKRAVEKELKKLDLHSFTMDNFFKPSGKLITNSLDYGYYETELNNDDSKLKIKFQLVNFPDIIIELT